MTPARQDELLDEAFEILTDWFVERQDNNTLWEDIDPEIDRARSLIAEAMGLTEDHDGQPDEYQENQDFAQDGDFENMSAEDVL